MTKPKIEPNLILIIILKICIESIYDDDINKLQLRKYTSKDKNNFQPEYELNYN